MNIQISIGTHLISYIYIFNVSFQFLRKNSPLMAGPSVYVSTVLARYCACSAHKHYRAASDTDTVARQRKDQTVWL